MPSEAEPRVAVVILNYRTPDLTIGCLETAVADANPETDRVVVVDNASGDESALRIEGHIREQAWAHVALVRSPRNGGFAAGNNVGVRHVRASRYLLLNSDARVRPGAIDILCEALDAQPDAGLVSPRLEGEDGEAQISCFRFHSPASEVIAGSATGPIRRLLARWDVPLPLADEPIEPEWTSFAAVMVRRPVFDAIGLLDEGFFMYYEDSEFCWRARRAGWNVRHEPRARVVHLRGGSSPVKALTAARKRRPRYYYASRRRFFRQCYGPAGPLAANLCWTLGRLVAWVRETFFGKPPHTVEHELLDVWRG